MKIGKLILTSALLVACCFSSAAKAPVVKYGVEWGLSANIFYSQQLNYISAQGYRVDESGSGMKFSPNGQVMGSVGINAGDHLCLDLLSGYMGVSQNNRMIPLLLRAGYHFRGIESDGIFAFIDAGVGFHTRRSWEPERKPAIMADGGAGYRFVLTRRSSIDLFADVKGTFDSLMVSDPDSGEFLPEENIRKNTVFFLSVCLGVRLNF